jgi:hypothetical protein
MDTCVVLFTRDLRGALRKRGGDLVERHESVPGGAVHEQLGYVSAPRPVSTESASR